MARAAAKTVRVSVRQLRGRLSDYLKQAESGSEIEVTAREKLVARIVPPRPMGPRPLGLLKGQIEIAPDFDKTSPELIALMEGRARKR
ncbi:MAG: type II toxin-antitoxin system prevent-host-death family antitoxin [Alphaproteobacteria bacterium]|nr:type II toxin-antitoxin system prevent-host-death family antitoxin [Alphaproteobacteria bacterium]